MITAIGRIIAAVLLAAALTGCGSSFEWTGEWTGERDIAIRPGITSDLASTIRRVRLRLEPDGTFELVEAGMPRAGIYRVNGMSGTLETRTVLGRPVQELKATIRPATITANQDGTITLDDPQAGDGRPVVLKPTAQPTGPGVRKR